MIEPTVQLQRKIPQLSIKKMSQLAKGQISDDVNTPNVSQWSTPRKCELIPKVTSISVDEVFKQKSYKADIGSEPQEKVKPFTLTASFTPKKVQGLKVGSSISRGLYGHKRYGTGRGNVASQHVKNLKPLSNFQNNGKQLL